MGQCSAIAKSTRRRCAQHAMVGKNVCSYHGGKTPKGPASPHFKTGLQSSDLPTRLQARYEAGQDDPDLVTLRKELRIATAKLGDALNRIDDSHPDEIWADLQKHREKLLTLKPKAPQRIHHMNEIICLIQDGAEEWAKWEGVIEWLEVRRRLVDTEARRSKSLSEETAIRAFGAAGMLLVEVLKKHIEDDKLTRRIASDFSNGLTKSMLGGVPGNA